MAEFNVKITNPNGAISSKTHDEFITITMSLLPGFAANITKLLLCNWALYEGDVVRGEDIHAKLKGFIFERED